MSTINYNYGFTQGVKYRVFYWDGMKEVPGHCICVNHNSLQFVFAGNLVNGKKHQMEGDPYQDYVRFNYQNYEYLVFSSGRVE